MPYIPHKYINGSIEWEHVDELPVECPYCGHKWNYKGEGKHVATCHGTNRTVNLPLEKQQYVKKLGFTDEDMQTWSWICHKKVRLHPRLIKTHKTPSEINFPNKNYEPIEVEDRGW